MFWLGFKNIHTGDTSYMLKAEAPYGRASWSTREEIEEQIRSLKATGHQDPANFEYVVDPVFSPGRRVYWEDGTGLSGYGNVAPFQTYDPQRDPISKGTLICVQADGGKLINALPSQLIPQVLRVEFVCNLRGPSEAAAVPLRQCGKTLSPYRPQVVRELDPGWLQVGNNYVGTAHGSTEPGLVGVYRASYWGCV